MPKLNIYEQQYKASTPRATGENFGAAEGRAQEAFGRQVEKTGNVLTDLAVRSQNRLDGINTARAYQQYRATMDEEFLTAQQSEDFSDPKILQAFNARAQELASETVSGFEGSLDARAKLTTMIEQERGGYSRTAYDTHVKEGYRVVGEFAQSNVDTIANRAKGSPEMLSAHLAEWNAEFEVLRDALPPEMEGKFYDAGISQITQSVFGSYMDTGHFEEALATLELPGVRDAMGGDTYNKLRMDARSLQYDATKKAREVQQDLDLFFQITGQEPTDAMVAQKLNMLVSSPEKTTGQKLREANKELLDLGFTKEENPGVFTKAFESIYEVDLGLSGSDINENFGDKPYASMSRIFGLHQQGNASDRDKRTFVESAFLYENGKRDASGMVIEQPLTPHFAKLRDQFVQELGLDPSQSNQTPGSSLAGGSNSGGMVTPSSELSGRVLNLDNNPAPNFKISQVVGHITGFSSRVRAFGEEFTATQDWVEGESDVFYRQYTNGVFTELKNSLRQGDKYLATETIELEKEYGIPTGALKGDSGVLLKLAALDTYISKRLKLVNTLKDDPTQGRYARTWARTVAPMMEDVRDSLGIVWVGDNDDHILQAYENQELKVGQPIFYVGSDGITIKHDIFTPEMLEILQQSPAKAKGGTPE